MRQKIIRTRFAPSPTGFLHLGGARTALFSYLFAKHYNGKFYLRIEDTDLKRSTNEAIQAIFTGLDWLNIQYDDKVVYQSKRKAIYQQWIEKLLQENKAYRCYCSKDRLTKLREQQLKQKLKPKYDGHCRDLPDQTTQKYVIRFKNPQTDHVIFDDLILGTIKINNFELDDLIIQRQDGSATYNFTVVVDDCLMQISHVIRGMDHINNTPRQINLMQALGFNIPKYAHVPLIYSDDGQKLSKRHGAISVMTYQELGILPEALLNYLLRLGWSHGNQEIFSQHEMIKLFNITNLSKSASRFDMQKLLWLNKHYLQNIDDEYLTNLFVQQLSKLNIATKKDTHIKQIIELQRKRCDNIVMMAEQSIYFFQQPQNIDTTLLQQYIFNNKTLLQEILEIFTHIKNIEWQQPQIISQCLKTFVKTKDIKFKQLAQALRVAIAGTIETPAINIIISLIEKNVVLQRLKNILRQI